MAGARLKDVEVKKARASERPYKLFDGGGMFLYVTPQGNKVWRWQFRFQGKYQRMSLGSYPEVTLQEARLKHQAQEKILHGGRNPMAVRKEWKRASTASLEADSAGKTFAEIEKMWFEHWRAGKDRDYARQMEDRIANDILPRFGNISIDEIEAPISPQWPERSKGGEPMNWLARPSGPPVRSSALQSRMATPNETR